MNKFVFEATLSEVYKEILFLSSNYQKEKIDLSDLKHFTSQTYKDLSKSKQLNKFSDGLRDLSMKNPDFIYDPKFLEILDTKKYDFENTKYIIDYLNKNVDYYLSKFHDLEKTIGFVLDIKKKENGYKGEYPLYIILNPDKCTIERCILSFNTLSFINKETNKLTFKVTYMEYEVPLKEYLFNNIDLREKTKKEIIDIMDSSIEINLNNVKYYVSPDKEIDIMYEFNIPKEGELSLLLNKRSIDGDNFKTALKKSLKSTLRTFVIIVIITIIFFLIKYFGGK